MSPTSFVPYKFIVWFENEKDAKSAPQAYMNIRREADERLTKFSGQNTNL